MYTTAERKGMLQSTRQQARVSFRPSLEGNLESKHCLRAPVTPGQREGCSGEKRGWAEAKLKRSRAREFLTLMDHERHKRQPYPTLRSKVYNSLAVSEFCKHGLKFRIYLIPERESTNLLAVPHDPSTCLVPENHEFTFCCYKFVYYIHAFI